MVWGSPSMEPLWWRPQALGEGHGRGAGPGCGYTCRRNRKVSALGWVNSSAELRQLVQRGGSPTNSTRALPPSPVLLLIPNWCKNGGGGVGSPLTELLL